MHKIKTLFQYFSKSELIIWGTSLFFTILSFFIFDRSNYLTLIASVIGVTSLIFNAKGNPFGQFLTIIFSLLYGYISFISAYYGEMITYLGMTGPMAVLALISWLKNPYKGNKKEVAINNIKLNEIVWMILVSIIITIIFYYLLKAFHTNHLFISTISVTTSFIAVYLTFRRSPYFAIAYACNDIILIILWILASFADLSYISVMVCFAMFLVNDLYGFFNWLRIQQKQHIQK